MLMKARCRQSCSVNVFHVVLLRFEVIKSQYQPMCGPPFSHSPPLIFIIRSVWYWSGITIGNCHILFCVNSFEWCNSFASLVLCLSQRWCQSIQKESFSFSPNKQILHAVHMAEPLCSGNLTSLKGLSRCQAQGTNVHVLESTNQDAETWFQNVSDVYIHGRNCRSWRRVETT